MKKARKLDPGGIYNVVYPPENIFNLSNEEETKISDTRHHPIFWMVPGVTRLILCMI
ncbi:MAG TPA: hypothetical protein VIG98_08465 [Bacillus sp. (in: firmicutes)]